MKSKQRTTLVLALASALSMPALSLAADAARDGHSSYHPGQAEAAAPAQTAVADRAKTMRERMMTIRAEKNPTKRKALLEAQMKDMETMIEEGNCPMMAGGKSGGMGMGMMGGGMMMGQGGPGMDDMMGKRMDMMEKRMDMMQMMMQRSGQGAQGSSMGMPGQDDLMSRRMEMMEKRLDMMQKSMGMPGK